MRRSAAAPPSRATCSLPPARPMSRRWTSTPTTDWTLPSGPAPRCGARVSRATSRCHAAGRTCGCSRTGCCQPGRCGVHCGRGCGMRTSPSRPRSSSGPATTRSSPTASAVRSECRPCPTPRPACDTPSSGHDDKPLPRRFDEMLLALEWTPAWIIESAADTVRPKPCDLPPAYNAPKPIFRDQVDLGTASDILMALWGVPRAAAGRTVLCPAHSEKHPSLNILPDNERVLCMTPGCELNNDGHGRGTWELTQMAPKAARG